MAVSSLVNVWKFGMLLESLAVSSSAHLLWDAWILVLGVDIGLQVVHLVLLSVESATRFCLGYRQRSSNLTNSLVGTLP